jgi:hypothetical protein
MVTDHNDGVKFILENSEFMNQGLFKDKENFIIISGI